MGHINETRGERLEALPKTPEPEELRLETRWISELVSTCDAIFWALDSEGIVEFSDPIVGAIKAGEPVPDDIRQPAIDFHNSWVVMFFRLRPMAVNWATRFWERAEVDSDLDRKAAEWAEKFGEISSETFGAEPAFGANQPPVNPERLLVHDSGLHQK